MKNQVYNRQSIIFCLFITLFTSTNIIFSKNHLEKHIEKQDDINQHHVICSYEIQPTTQNDLSRLNELVHTATYEIKQYFKTHHAQSEHSTKHSHHHPRHRDSVFFIHFDYKFGHWTLYKPSFVSYEDFVDQARKIYSNHGINVHFQKEQTIHILQNDQGFDNEYLTLEELELYRNMSDKDFDAKIKKLILKSSESNDLTEKINRLKKIKKMKKFFFWHLQIPTTGLLPGDDFDIDDQYKPLAWNFLLWDLAPKKGEGVQVAIIDTGVSAFNLKEAKLKKRYKKNVNVYAPCDLQSYGYNLVSEDGLDPIRQVAINFGHYCDHNKFNSDELMRNLPGWIKNFITNNNSIQIEQYFIRNAKKTSLDESKTKLNKTGELQLQDLLYGKYGIAPKDSKTFFNIVNLENPYNQNTLLETLPAPSLIGNNDPFAAGHGTFTHGVVNAKMYNGQGLTGFAPNAKVIMIKAFHDSGTTNKTTLNGALERALALKSPIVSMSLKITDSIDEVKDATLKKLIDSIDYVVAASGNDGDSPKLHNKEAYPAKFDSVAFDVGAFQYGQGDYNVCSFTQKELNVGPKFVAPGFNIFSSGLTPNQTTDSMYVFMTGTSVAVPVVTGFLALVVAEFQDAFTREEILKVMYKFSIKLNHDSDWQQGTILGTLDMRSCLFCLHVLKALRVELNKHTELNYSFIDHFDNLVQAIYDLNYYVPSCYEQQFGCSLTSDFAGYNKAAHTQEKDNKNINFFVPSKYKSVRANLKSAINFTVQAILTALEPAKNRDKVKNIDDELNLKLSTVLSMQQFNVFAQLPQVFQDRIKAVFTPKEKFNLLTI